MACPDRDNDKRILAEIERRKQIKDNYPFERMIFEGEFFDIENLPEFERIHRIDRIEGGWELTFKKQK